MLLVYSASVGGAGLVFITQGTPNAITFPLFIGAGVGVMLFFRFRYIKAGRQARARITKVMKEQAQVSGLWAMWFRVNCGVETSTCLIRSGSSLIISLAIIGIGGWYQQASCMVVGVVCGLWCLLVIMTCALAPDSLWKLMLVQSAVFSIVMVYSTTVLTTRTGGALAFVGVLLTQLNLERTNNERQAQSVFIGFFSILNILVALVAVLACSSITGFGLAFDSEEGTDGAPTFQFPLRGIQERYEFCGLSWHMARPQPSLTRANFTTDLEYRAFLRTWMNAWFVSNRCRDHALRLVDFVFMSHIAYYIPEQKSIEKALAKYLPGWKVRHISAFDTSKSTYNSFVHLARGGTNVIAIRGTWSAIEALQDLKLFMPAAFLQIAQTVGPSLFNPRSTVDVLRLTMTESRIAQFMDLLEYTRSIVNQSRAQGGVTYITGHSLGGGLGAIVGALTEIPAITFSAPGLMATSATLDPQPSASQMRHFGVNVVPANDIVPRVDEQTSATLNMDCNSEDPLTCHMIGTTMCEILFACGDGGSTRHARGFNFTCKQCAATGQSNHIEVCKKNAPSWRTADSIRDD